MALGSFPAMDSHCNLCSRPHRSPSLCTDRRPAGRSVRQLPMKHYLSASTLGIKEWERDGLIKTLHKLPLLETTIDTDPVRDDLTKEYFNIGQTATNLWFDPEDEDEHGHWSEYTCGTVACIGGWNYMLQHGLTLFSEADDYVGGIDLGHPLYYLYYPEGINWEKITNFVAAAAVEHFLETGKVDWKYALANA